MNKLPLMFYMNKLPLLYFVYTIQLLIVVYIIYNTYYKQEGFNTYFRKTLRPQMRNVKDAHKTLTYHFNEKFVDFKRTLGFS